MLLVALAISNREYILGFSRANSPKLSRIFEYFQREMMITVSAEVTALIALICPDGAPKCPVQWIPRSCALWTNCWPTPLKVPVDRIIVFCELVIDEARRSIVFMSMVSANSCSFRASSRMESSPCKGGLVLVLPII